MPRAPRANRDKQINMRVTVEEAERFKRVAAHYGLSIAQMIRMLVKRDDETMPRFRRRA
jgi:predicted DNA binding CopG/RHH family protein